MKRACWSLILLAAVSIEVRADTMMLAAVTEQELFFADVPTVIGAAKYEQKLNEAPASVTVVSAEDIKNYGYQTLGEALRGVTGLYVTNDRNYEYLGVRGYYLPGDYSSRVLILVDGQTANDPVYGSGFIGQDLGIDIDSIKRIEVIKGPGSALYGTYALFSVINIVTKDVRDVDGLGVSGTVGSYNARTGKFGFGKETSGGVGISLYGSWVDIGGQNLYFKEFDDPATNNGVFENGDQETAYRYFAKMTYRDLAFEAGTNLRTKNIPTASFGTIFNDNRSRTADGSAFAELTYAPRLDETKRLLARVFYRHYRYDGDYLYLYQDEAGNPYEEDSADYGEANWAGSEVQLNWEMSDNNRLISGGEYQNHFQILQGTYDKGLLGPDYYYVYFKDERSQSVVSFYLQDIYKARKNLSLVLGGRLDRYSTFGETINPRVGVIYNPWEMSTVKLLYGTAFRAPSFYELYYSAASNKPNPDLEPEQLATQEVIFEQEIRRNISGSIAFYSTDIKNLISYVDTGEVDPVSGASILQYQNTGRAAAQGVEADLKAEWKQIKGKIGYNLQASEDKVTHKKLVNSPEHSGNIGVTVPFLDRAFLVTAEAVYLGRRMTVKEDWVDPYVTANLVLFSDRILPGLEITAKIYNLFDAAYADPASTEFLQTSIPQNTRNFLLKISYKI